MFKVLCNESYHVVIFMVAGQAFLMQRLEFHWTTTLWNLSLGMIMNGATGKTQFYALKLLIFFLSKFIGCMVQTTLKYIKQFSLLME